uniref:Uncharacterized protein n=1 Tax=Cacopsylla melanoneura TaxID=428564 RepID=A0A8D8ZBW5_9HEMI
MQQINMILCVQHCHTELSSSCKTMNLLTKPRPLNFQTKFIFTRMYLYSTTRQRFNTLNLDMHQTSRKETNTLKKLLKQARNFLSRKLEELSSKKDILVVK